MKKMLVIITILFAIPLFASGVRELSIDDVVKRADVAFEGTCLSREVVKNDQGLFTRYEFNVSKWIKKPSKNISKSMGKASLTEETFTFTQKGIPIEDTKKYRQPAAQIFPSYKMGEQNILFLRKLRNGSWIPVGARQGAARVTKDASGKAMVKSYYMKSLMKKSRKSNTKALTNEVVGGNEINYDSFMKAVEGASAK